VNRQQTRHQDLTIIRANEHFHDCSGGHFKIFPLYKVNTEGEFLRRRKETLLINFLKPSLQMVMIRENQILMMTRSLSDFSAAFCCL
jgi:hypothetical protein